MNKKTLHKLSYGLFILTSKDELKDNGCIINTAMQVSSDPLQLSISVNKSNFTHDLIKRSGQFNISILSQDAPFDLFKHFGFQSGRDIDKFSNIDYCSRSTNGIYYINKFTNGYISVKVEQCIDLGSHSMFIGKITDMDVLNDLSSTTYEYYQNNIKPKVTQSKTQTIWRCTVCGYEYEGEILPDDYICPLCKHPASDFEKIERK